MGGAIARLANHSVTDRRVTQPPRGELRRAVRAASNRGLARSPADLRAAAMERTDLYRGDQRRFASPDGYGLNEEDSLRPLCLCVSPSSARERSSLPGYLRSAAVGEERAADFADRAVTASRGAMLSAVENDLQVQLIPFLLGEQPL